MWGTILKTALPLILGQVAGHQQKNAAGQASQGARLQDILPLLMPMLQQQQQHAAENYTAQQQQYGQIQPLQEAIRKMALNLMPNGGR